MVSRSLRCGRPVRYRSKIRDACLVFCIYWKQTVLYLNSFRWVSVFRLFFQNQFYGRPMLFDFEFLRLSVRYRWIYLFELPLVLRPANLSLASPKKPRSRQLRGRRCGNRLAKRNPGTARKVEDHRRKRTAAIPDRSRAAR